MKPGPFNFQLLEQLYGNLDPNARRNLRGDRLLKDGDDLPPSHDDTPEEVQVQINNVVAEIEKKSCRSFAASSKGLQVTQLAGDDDGEEACEIQFEGGYSIQIRKLLAKNWDLIDV